MPDVVTPVDFGGRMRRQREERGVTLQEIATATKLSVTQLEALERNDISRLPGGIFLRGIVRSYAQEIGSDPETTVRDFIARFPDESVVAGSPQVYESDYESATAPGVNRVLIVTAILLVVALVVGVASYFVLHHR